MQFLFVIIIYVVNIEDNAMITVIKNQDDRIIHVEVEGKITRKDVKKVAQIADEKIKEYGKIKALIVLRYFEGYTPSAFFEDLKFSLTHLDSFSHMAICGEGKLEEFASKISAMFTKGEIRYFDIIKIEDAINWVERERLPV
jgi:hypothetical protein